MTQLHRAHYTVPKPQAFELGRPALLRTLGELDETSLVVLSAPSGFGKSTLLTQYARELKQVAWLSLTSESADALTLLRALAESIRWRYRTALPLFHRSLQNQEDKDRLAHALARDCDQQDYPLTIVVDGAEHLSADSAAALLAFMRNLGLGHRLAVAGRTDSPLPVEGLLGERTVVRLSDQVLAFSEKEVRLLLMIGQRVHSAPEVWSRTRGWPLAVQMIARGVEPDAPNLLEALLERFPSDLRAALIDLSVLDFWSGEDADALGTTLPRGWLDTLRQSGAPLLRAEKGGCQPHELLRTLLLEQLRLDPPRYRAKQRSASTLYEQRGALLSAVTAALEADQFERAVALSQAPVRQWAWRWEWATARQHLAVFPEAHLPTDLRNLYGHSLLQTGAVEQGFYILSTLVEKGEAGALTYVGLAFVAVQQGDHDRVAQLTERGFALSPEPLERVFLLQLRALSLAGRDWSAAYDAAVQADTLARRVNHEVLSIMTTTAQAYAAQGLVSEVPGESARVLTQTRDALRYKVGNALQRGFSNHAFSALTMVAHLDFQVGESEKSVRLVRELLRSSGQRNPYSLPYLLLRLGDHLQEQGEFSAAVVQYKQALGICREVALTTLTHLCVYATCECLMYTSKVDDAASLLSTFETGRFPRSPRAFEDPSYDYIRGLLAFRRRHDRAAEEALTRFVGASEKLVDYRHRIGLGHAYLAELARREGRLRRAHIDTLIRQTESTQALWTLKREARFLKGLYQGCIDRGWHEAVFEACLEESRDHLLVLRTFGTVHAELEGQPLRLYPKARTLLAYLALYGPAELPEILSHLWGERTQRSRRSFKVHLSEVRRSLEAVVPSEALVVYNPNSRTYQLSGVRVESDFGRLKRAARQPSVEVKRAAVKDYGVFCPNLQTAWAQEQRDMLEQEVAHLALQVAEVVQPQSVEVAIEFYAIAARLHPDSEEGAQGLRRLSLSDDRQVARAAHEVLTTLDTRQSL